MRCRKLHQVHGFSCKSGLREFRAVIFLHFPFLLLTVCHGGHSQAIDRPPPLKAKVGDHVTLPCHVKQAVDADNMLEWSRPDLDPRFVHVRRFGEDWVRNQNQLYTGRTSVSIEGLRHGDCSLKLSRVKLSDQGTYRCFIPSLNTDINVQLLVDEFYKNSSSSPDGVDPVKPVDPVDPVDSVDPVVIAVVVGILLLLPVVIFVVWKCRQSHTRKRQDDEEPQRDDPEQTPLMKRETDGELQTAGGEMMKSPDNEEDDNNFKMSKEETGLVHQQHETGSKTNLDEREAEKPSVSAATGWSEEEKKTGQTLISDELQVSCSADMNQDRTETQTGVKEQEENETTDVTGDQEPESSDKPLSDQEPSVSAATDWSEEEKKTRQRNHELQVQVMNQDEQQLSTVEIGKQTGVNEQKENKTTSVRGDQEPESSDKPLSDENKNDLNNTEAAGGKENGQDKTEPVTKPINNKTEETRDKNDTHGGETEQDQGEDVKYDEKNKSDRMQMLDKKERVVNEQEENNMTSVIGDQEPEDSEKPLSDESRKDLNNTETAEENESKQDKTEEDTEDEDQSKSKEKERPTNTETQETGENDTTDGGETSTTNLKTQNEPKENPENALEEGAGTGPVNKNRPGDEEEDEEEMM